MKYKVTFRLGSRVMNVEAGSMEEAEEQARLDLFDDLKHNPNEFIVDVSITNIKQR